MFSEILLIKKVPNNLFKNLFPDFETNKCKEKRAFRNELRNAKAFMSVMGDNRLIKIGLFKELGDFGALPYLKIVPH